MGNRRMFSLDIIDSDAFLSMPISSQSLYFHLGMRADDDGVVDNPKSIKRMIGATDDDLSILIAKKFVIPFEDSGLIVIKHWLINNAIRKDRYIASKYQEEIQQLNLDENNAYTLLESESTKVLDFSNKDQEEKNVKLSGARLKRYEAMKNGDLPYSFSYKIRQAFNGKTCPICHLTMNMASDKLMPTIQHNIPISLGGKHEITNISVICKSCNTSIQNRQITNKLNNDEVIKVWECIGNGNQSKDNISKDKISKDKISKDKISIIEMNEMNENNTAHACDNELEIPSSWDNNNELTALNLFVRERNGEELNEDELRFLGAYKNAKKV